MSPTDTALVFSMFIALGSAVTAWIRAETAARTSTRNGEKIGDLATTAAVHEEKINGLLAPRVQEIMAPVVAAAVEQARKAAVVAIADANIARRRATDPGVSDTKGEPS